jgi:HD-GYP domain-containing protein (c-di-GMP phosphodiesterase class II)
MVSTRPYSPARTHADALAQLVVHAGTQFDARCVQLVAGFVPARGLAAV